MFHVITGGSGSGKSAFAEDCIVKYHRGDSPLYYVATMMPFGVEMEAKIDRHRKMRAGKGFETIECYLDLHQTAEEFKAYKMKGLHSCDGKSGAEKPDVLLECMSNLVANEWFAFVQKYEANEARCKNQDENTFSIRKKGSCFSIENLGYLVEKIWIGVQFLLAHCENVVVVTNEVCSECGEDTQEMDCYKWILSGVNRRMAAVADRVTEVVYGIPVEIKSKGL